MIPIRRIVVGYDGSADGARAVQWAAEHAAQQHAVLEVVHSYDYPYLERLGAETRTRLHDDAVAVADAGVRLAREADADVEVRAVVEVGEPGRVLVARAEGADLLVVGHQGANRAHHRMLGSVAVRCVHHAPCSVVVLRDDVTGDPVSD